MNLGFHLNSVLRHGIGSRAVIFISPEMPWDVLRTNVQVIYKISVAILFYDCISSAFIYGCSETIAKTTKQMILFLTLLTGFTSKTVNLITTWLIMVVFFCYFFPFRIHRNDFFLVSSFYKYKVLLLYPLKILFYTSVMVLNFKIMNLTSYLVTSREVFVRLCFLECIYFIITSLFSPGL